MKASKWILSLIASLITTLAFAQDGLITSRSSFKTLFNKHRVAQPSIIPWSGNFFPYGNKGTAIKLDKQGFQDERGTSPLQAYGKLTNFGLKAHNWELDNHNCDKLEAELKKSCQAWWGHCNGWAAASIKEQEPRKSIDVKGKTLSIADRKGILTELWLSSYSINTGETDKSTKAGSWLHDHTKKDPSPAYQAFWDISPKTFFMVFTNQIGIMKTGVVIDRHTGDEVWNQPVVGYRFMPIRSSDIKEVKEGSTSYWSVKMGVKLFWANDLGIEAGHVSKPFDIFKMTRDERGLKPVTGEVETISDDYEGRYLEFTLNFASEVIVSADGTEIIKAGRMIGEGVWEHQLNSKKYTLEQLKHSHPDFIWLPTNAFQDTNGYGNPYMLTSISETISGSGSGTSPGPISVPMPLTLSFRLSDFKMSQLTEESAKKIISNILLRDGIKSNSLDVQISLGYVIAKMEFVDVDVKYITDLFKAAKLPFNLIE